MLAQLGLCVDRELYERVVVCAKFRENLVMENLGETTVALIRYCACRVHMAGTP